jgi:hypothetical protein
MTAGPTCPQAARALRQSAAVRLLFLTTALPSARRTGGEVVSDSVVRALRADGHDVLVVGYARPGGDAAAGEICVGRRPIETAEAGPRAGLWLARALITRAPYSSAKYRSGAYVAAAEELLGDGAEAVVVDHPQVHFAAEGPAGARAPLVFLAHNAEGPLYRDLAAAKRGAARRLYAREAALIEPIEARLARRARQVWTLTEADAAHVASLAPQAEVHTLEAAPSLAPPTTPAPPEYDVALLGTWTWDANRAGLDWFLGEVLPLLGDELTVTVGGAGSEALSARHPRLAGVGVVPDAGDFLGRARVVAIPSLAGGGTQVKTLDAIAAGVGVVASPLAVRGLGDLPGAVAVADTAERFASALRRLAREVDRPRAAEDAAAWAAARRARLDEAVAELAGNLEARSRRGSEQRVR